MLRLLHAALASLALLILPLAGSASAAEIHKLALQVSDNDPAKMTAALNVAANVSKFYSGKGEEVEIQIIAFDGGMHMLREDTSPVKPRLKSFREGMPNVSFIACDNTLHSMARSEGKEPVLVPDVQHVEAGVVRLIELSEQGWTIVRP
jgi:intracellular sulfur oxidation DsrE/DsrF family protein